MTDKEFILHINQLPIEQLLTPETWVLTLEPERDNKKGERQVLMQMRAEQLGAVDKWADFERDMGLATAQNGVFEYFEYFEGLPQYPEFDPFTPPDTSKLPTFPVDSLPAVLREYAKTAAESIQVPVDMTAITALASCSLCVQGKYMINPKPGFYEPLNLYAVIVAAPSDRKSPVVREVLKPIHQYTQEENQRRGPDIRDYQRKKAVLTKSISLLTDRAARGPGKGRSVSLDDVLAKQKELDELVEVKPLRLVADDVTPEALTKLLAQNDGRMAIVSTEGGVFSIMSGMYSGNQANIDPFLKAYSGDFIQVDRVGRESETITHPALTMLLMIQPQVLSEIMKNKEFGGRGLLARFLYSIPRSLVGSRSYNTPDIDSKAAGDYTQLVKSLLEIDGGNKPSRIRLTDGAHRVAEGFYYEIEKRIKGDLEDIEAWAGKCHGTTMRIAGVMHCCIHGERAAIELVSEETMLAAVNIAFYFIDHARAAFQMMGATESQREQDAKYIWKRLLSTGKTEISKSDLHQLCRFRGGFETAVDMGEGLEELTERGYIRIDKVYPQNTQNTQKPTRRGRPTEKITINPLALEYEEAKRWDRHPKGG